MDANQLIYSSAAIEGPYNNHFMWKLNLTGKLTKDRNSQRMEALDKREKFYIKTSVDNSNFIYTVVILS